MQYLFYLGWFVILLVAALSWVPMLFCFGWRFLYMVPAMWKLHCRSKRTAIPGLKHTPLYRELLLYLIAAAVLFYFGGFWTWIGKTVVVLVVARAFFAGRVPVILLVATPTKAALNLQRRLILLIHGGIVATSLDIREGEEGMWLFAGYVFRTLEKEDRAWRDSVATIARCAALIVVDAREESPVVEFESHWMMEQYGEKTLFVTRDDGSAPALADPGESEAAQGERTEVTVAALVAAIREAGLRGLPGLSSSLAFLKRD